MILPRRNRVAALAIVFAVLFVVAVALQGLIVVPLVAAEEGPLDALEAVRRAWGVFHPWHGDAVVGLELVGIAAAIAGTQVAFVAPLVGRPSLSASGHSLRASVVAAIFMALFLTGGLLFALLQGALLAVADPGQSTSFEHLELLGEPGIVAVALVLEAWLRFRVRKALPRLAIEVALVSRVSRSSPTRTPDFGSVPRCGSAGLV